MRIRITIETDESPAEYEAACAKLIPYAPLAGRITAYVLMAVVLVGGGLDALHNARRESHRAVIAARP